MSVPASVGLLVLKNSAAAVSFGTGTRWHCCSLGGSSVWIKCLWKVLGRQLCKTETILFCIRDQACGQVEGLSPARVELRRMLSVRVSAEWVNKPTSGVVRMSFMGCLGSTTECNAALTLLWIDFSECHATQMRSLCQTVWVKPVTWSLTYSLWERSAVDEVIRKVQRSWVFVGRGGCARRTVYSK